MVDDGANKLGEYLEKKRSMEEKERFFMAAMENASKLLDDKDFDGAVGIYMELIPLAEDMAWTDKITLLKDLVYDAREQETRHAAASTARLSAEDRKAREKAFYSEALDVMGQASDAHGKREFQVALDLYTKSLGLLRQINAAHEIQVVNESIKKVEADMTRFKNIEVSRKRADEESTRVFEARVSKLAGDPDVHAPASPLPAVVDRKARETAIYNDALDVMGQASDAFTAKHFQHALDLYTKSLGLLRQINAAHEIQVVTESIAKVETDMARFKNIEMSRKRADEESARNVEQLAAKLARARETGAAAKDLELSKLQAAQEQKAMEDRLVDEAMALLDKANAQLKDAASLNFVSIEAKKARYDEVIFLYDDAVDVFKRAGWVEEADKVRDTIIKIKRERDAGLDALARKLAKNREAIEQAREPIVQKDLPGARGKDDKLASSILEKKLDQQRKRDAAFAALEDAGTALDTYEKKPKIIGGQLFKDNEYPELIRLYRKALGLFKDAGWVSEAARIEESIEILRKKEQDFLIEKEQFDRQQAGARQESEQATAALDARQKAALDRMQRDSARQVSFEESRAQSRAVRDEIDAVLTRAMTYYQKLEYARSEAEYKKVKVLMIEQGWVQEAENVQGTITMIEQKRQARERELLKKERSIDDVGSFARGIEELSAGMDVVQRESQKLETEARQAELHARKDAQKQREDAYYAVLGKAQAAMNARDHATGITAYGEALVIARELDWASQVRDVQDFLVLAREKQREADMKAIARDKEPAAPASSPVPRVQEPVPRDAPAPAPTQRQLEKAAGDEAYAIVDTGNLQWKSGDREAAIESFTSAASRFDSIGWARERDAVVQQVRTVEKEIEDEKLFAAKKQESEKTRLAYEAIDEAERCLRNKETQEAMACYDRAIELFDSIGWTKEATMVRSQVEKTKEELAKKLVADEESSESKKVERAYELIDEARKFQRDRKIFRAVECARDAVDIFKSFGGDWSREIGQVQKFVDELEREKAKKEELLKKLKMGDF